MHPSLFEMLVRNGVDRLTAHRVIAHIRRVVLSSRPLSALVVQLLREARGGVAPVPGRLPGSAVQLYTVAQAAEARTHFPLPADRSGDVPNRDGSPGGADSIWIDLGSPVQATGDTPSNRPLRWFQEGPAPLSSLELRTLTQLLLELW
jgi:hypothetical protein